MPSSLTDLRPRRRLQPPPHLLPYVHGSSFDFASLRTEYRARRQIPWRSLISLVAAITLLGFLVRYLPRAVQPVLRELRAATETADRMEGNLEAGYRSFQNRDVVRANRFFAEALAESRKLSQSFERLGQASTSLERLPAMAGSVIEKARLLTVAEDTAVLGKELTSIMSAHELLLRTQGSAEAQAWQDTISRLIRNVETVARDQAGAIEESRRRSDRLVVNLRLLRDPRAESIARLRDGLATTERALKELPSLLGENEPVRYLILFQNNAELRPSGGFLGSFATAIFSKGRLDKVEVNTNIYKLDKAFAKVSNVPPPEVLASALKIKKLTLRDSNWNLNPPQALDDVAAFYEAESQESVAGVLALDTTLVTELLRLTGPISMPEYEATIDADNFTTTLAHEIEREYFEDPVNIAVNEPKTILRDLLPRFMTAVFKEYDQDPERVTAVVRTAMRGRHLFFYFPDRNLQELVEAVDLSAGIKSGPGDYLLVNNANLNGRKSSLKIRETLDLLTEVTERGQLKNRLTVTRTHEGSGEWPDGINNNYLRLAVPRGSQLKTVSRDGASVTGEVRTSFEAGKVIYGLFLNTPPGKARSVTFEYTLPFLLRDLERSSIADRLLATVSDRGNEVQLPLLIQKQAGARADDFRWTFKLPPGYGARPAEVNEAIDQDKALSVTLLRP